MDMQLTTKTQEALSTAMQLALVNGNPGDRARAHPDGPVAAGEEGIAVALFDAVGARIGPRSLPRRARSISSLPLGKWWRRTEAAAPGTPRTWRDADWAQQVAAEQAATSSSRLSTCSSAGEGRRLGRHWVRSPRKARRPRRCLMRSARFAAHRV